MDEYIKRGAVIALLENMYPEASDETSEDFDEGYECGLAKARAQVREMETTDVRPVIHGYWIPIFENVADYKRGVAIKYKCSECGGIAKDETFSHAMDYEFCPRCGAKMNVGTDNG